MKKGTKRRRWLLLLLSMIVLAGIITLLLPQVFQLPVVQEKTRAFLAKQTGGSIAYEKETLTLFPTPCIRLNNLRLKKEDSYSVLITEVSATPHFLSLLRGKFNISKISLTGVDTAVQIPTQAPLPSLETVLSALQQHLETWMDMLEPVRQKKFMLDIEDAGLSLIRDEKPVFFFRNVSGLFNWQHPVASLTLNSQTDLWDHSILTLDANVATSDISGHLSAEKFIPGAVCSYLFPDASICLETSSLDADISWKTDDFKTWHLSIAALNPDITFRKETSVFHLRGKKAAGKMRIGATGIHASLSELNLDSPGLRLAGAFDLDTKTPLASWHVKAEKIDIASTREATRFFVGRFRTAQNITRILQAGEISQITMGQEARSPDELRKVAAFRLQGILEGGIIDVPKAGLRLTNSSGKITVADGILKASEARTRLGKSTGSRGNFALALTGEKPRPYHVACDIRADVAQLPQLLGRLTKNAVFAGEMADISSAEGSASGHLVLDKGDGPLQVAVDVSTFDLFATYQRIPFPVCLSGGGFSYRDGGIQVNDIQGSIGNSIFTGLSAALSWEHTPLLHISSARVEADTNELEPWLGKTLSACRNAETPTTDTGMLLVEHLQFDGPVDTPSAWKFQADGYVSESFSVCTPLFQSPVTVYQGSFTATEEKINVTGADLSVLDSRLSVDGSLEGYQAQASRVLNARIEGNLGPIISEWIYRQTGIPDILRWRTPIAVDPLTVRWHKTEGLSLLGEAAVPDGPRISFDIHKTEELLSVDHLDIICGETCAALSVIMDKSSLVIRFSGDLSHDTVAMILARDEVVSGSVHGDFNARYDLQPPFIHSMTGNLQAEDIDLTRMALPLKITQAALTGNGTSTHIGTARFTWKGNEFSSSGRITRSADIIALDLALAAGRLNWSDIKDLTDPATGLKKSVSAFLSGDVRFTCDSLTITPVLTLEPLETLLKFGDNRIDIVLEQAGTCGISFPGKITLLPDHVLFSFEPSATEQLLEPSIVCLRKGKVLMDGRYDLSGDLAFEWDRKEPLLKSLEGSATLTAEDGRIYKAALLAKLFSLINIGEILSGQFPDFEEEGFPYKTSVFSGQFKDGVFDLETGVIDSPSMKIFFEGKEDLVNRGHKLTIVVAPLKTVDAVVDKIPVLNDVLEKGLVIYPVKVTGSWEDPQLNVLSPTAVGSEVIGIMVRTLKLPVTIFEKIFSGNKTDQGKTTPKNNFE